MKEIKINHRILNELVKEVRDENSECDNATQIVQKVNKKLGTSSRKGYGILYEYVGGPIDIEKYIKIKRRLRDI